MLYKKMTALLLGAMLGISAAPAMTAGAASLGDLNGDGTSNASDAAMLLIEAARVGSGKAASFTSAQKTAADIDSDGTVNASDAAQILIYAAAAGSGSFTGTMQNYVSYRLNPMKKLTAIGPVMCSQFQDYDGNGTSEGYAIIDLQTESPETYALYFVSDKGEVKCMVSKFESGYKMLRYQKEYIGLYESYEGKGFFHYDMNFGGSGYTTYLYSVKNGKPYELDISGKLQGFFMENGKFYTTQNDFSHGYHEYPTYWLNYNKNTQQFSLGARKD